MLKSLQTARQWSLQQIDKAIRQAPLEPREKVRLQHFALFVIVGVVMMTGYGSYNFLTGNFLLGSLVVFCESSLIFGWLLMCYLPMGKSVYRIVGCIFCGLLMYMLVLGGEEGSKSLWMFIFPLIVIFLMGTKEGIIWSLSALFIGLLLLSFPTDLAAPYHYSHSFLIRFSTVYLIITAVASWFEYSREYFRSELEANYQQERRDADAVSQEAEDSLYQAHQQQLAVLDSITERKQKESERQAGQKSQHQP